MGAAADVAEEPDGKRELVSKIVPSGERIHVTIEQEDGPRKRQVVKVWREKATAASPP